MVSVYHCPIQSNNSELFEIVGRNISSILKTIINGRIS